MTDHIVLSAQNIKKNFHREDELALLKDVSIELEKGYSMAIVGKSGSGKSTLLNILGTLEAANSGDIFICNKKVSGSSANLLRNTHIGFVFQSFHLLDDFSLIDNVLMPAKIARKDTHIGSSCYLRAKDLLEQVGLGSMEKRLTKTLSGGEKQRACIARALCNSPDIIFADEPTGNLDSSNTKIISSLLIDATKKEGKSLILVTHDQELADLCDKTFQLKDGFLHRIR